MGDDLKALSIPFEFETQKIEYIQPEKKRTYKPDFTFPGSTIIIESKGRFITADRQKHLFIQTQYPDLDIRFVFSNPNARISKLSKTTYAMWCERYGFKYAKKTVPREWIEEIKAQQRSNSCLTTTTVSSKKRRKS